MHCLHSSSQDKIPSQFQLNKLADSSTCDKIRWEVSSQHGCPFHSLIPSLHKFHPDRLQGSPQQSQPLLASHLIFLSRLKSVSMASTSACIPNTENEHTTTSEEEIVVAHPPSTSSTPSATTLFSSCFNFCSFFLSLCSTSTGRHPNAFQEESIPSPSDTHAFQQLAPSTSTSATSNRKLPYDVFINHRGSDVKHTVAATLYKTLAGIGLRVFLDNEELQFGDFLPTEIEEAMSSASLHIAIFSQNYAYSPWCLAELSFMLKTGTQIVPVFYHVQPDDVRHAKGVYAIAFSRHQKKGRYSKEKLQEWKNALNSVSFNVGGIIQNDDDEGPLMKKIVGSVLKKIKNVPFVVANHPIGLDEAAKEFERTILQCTQNCNNVKIVGIWGMGGSGKTTLAKHVYNNKYKLMDKSSFLLDIRDASSKSKLHEKQKKLLQDLGLSGVSVDNVEEGQGILANRLRAIQVLIVLDDVDSVDQLNALVPKKDSLGLSSLILVTSREFEVLQCWGIPSESIYKVKRLNGFHAQQLFCWHAFLQPSPCQGFEYLVKQFLKICDGLPLSLKVFGAQLYGNFNKDNWKIQLQKISRILPKDIKERLKVSYDALDAEEKEIFLDVACFFIGEKRSSAIAAWDGLGWTGQHSWEKLYNKCLVEVDDFDDRIRMHDHIRDLGREIANDQSPYRLWFPQQIVNVGNEVQGIAIRGIMATAGASTSENEEFLVCFQDGKLKFKANGVKYGLEPSSLRLNFFHVKGNYYNKVIGDLSRELVWLRWEDIEERSLQTFSSLKNLRVLELHGKENGEHQLEELWDSDSNAPVQLRELVMSGCMKFQGFPKSIGRLQHLKKIIIKYGDMMRSLPEEFCLLQSLEHLQLSGEELSSLPSNFGDLRNLRYLKFSNCKKLRGLPLSFKKLTLLQYLSFNNCYELNFESDIMEDMTRLVYFEIDGSKQLEKLPRHITNQASLTELTCYNIERLKEVPVNIGQLRKLRTLGISSKSLTSLPTSVGDLSSLTQLVIHGCPKLECLPESIGNLSSPTYLYISGCRKVECLPESLTRLHLLQRLNLADVGLKSLPKSFGQLINLQELWISECPISELHIEAGLFTCLKWIYLYSTHVAKISISTDLPQLERLTIKDNRHLKEIDGVLPNALQDLCLERCPKLEVLPSFAQLASLKYLTIIGCYGVKKIGGLEHCGATAEGLRKVELQTMSGSGFEGFVQSMKKSPREGIRVCSRAGGDAATIVNSFACPNLSLIHSFANQKAELRFKLPRKKNAGCILLCFVVNCRSPKTKLEVRVSGNDVGKSMELEGGKWVWTALLTEVHLPVGTLVNKHVEVEKGVVLIGEEESARDAFTHLCLLLHN